MKEFCEICQDYTEHTNKDESIVCDVCGNVTDPKRKRYIICGLKDNEEVIKSTKALLEMDPSAIIIPEEIALKYRLSDSGIPVTNGRSPSYLDMPLQSYPIHEMEDFRYSHLTKKEREANIVPVRTEPKIQRNEPCPCGSGKKYKKCCGNENKA